MIKDEIIQVWDGSNFNNSGKLNFSYNAALKLTELLSEVWISGNWVNQSLLAYTYNGQNQQTEQLYQIWNNNAWENQYKYTYTYDGNGNQTEELFQIWVNNMWENSSRKTMTYDGQNRLFEEITQFWNSTWENSFKNIYSYNSDNNVSEILSQNWQSSVWVNYEKDILTWSPFSDVEERVEDFLSFRLYENYPNPFNPSTKIKFFIPRSGVVQLKIYDLLGREISTLVNEFRNAGEYIEEFNAINLPSGIYFYELTSESNVVSKKMLLLK
ncbi:MAG: T9SS type A sorting domain-containing protein [Ignavibacteriaceae bacterium]|nr:T9SS type A sorting domain-containing protein [Ignavibacteriaceae bacterium]